MSGAVWRESPYVGLMPYREEDAPFFFGRDGDREIITANLMAARLTVLYGPSGVGKSSILRAGVAHHLRQSALQERAARGSAEYAVVVFGAWRGDPLVGLEQHMREAVLPLLPTGAEPPPTGSGGFLDQLQAWTERLDGTLFIILDQFEEYFLYHGSEDGPGTFAVEFPRAVKRLDLRVGFLISIREDALARLDRFKGRIPSLFDNYLRIRHLDLEGGREAIEGPLERLSEEGGPEERVRVEPALVEALLQQVETGHLLTAESGRGGLGHPATGRADPRIETPYLQLVLRRLWAEEMQRSSRVLRLETLQRLGGAEAIVRGHLDTVLATLSLDDRVAAARMFHHLVTPGGTKIALSAADLASHTELPQSRVERVLERLSDGAVRILRPVPPAFEIFHDVLAPAILDWRRRFHAWQERERLQRHSARRLRRAIAAVGLGGVVLVAGMLGAPAYKEWREQAHATGEEYAVRDSARLFADVLFAAEEMPVDPDSPPGAAQPAEPQTPAEPLDARERRSGIVVRFFQPEHLERTGLAHRLRELGFTVEANRGRFTDLPNSISFGQSVPLEDVELLASEMVQRGLPVNRIRTYQDERGRDRVIEVVHARAVAALPSLTDEEIPEIVRFVRRP